MNTFINSAPGTATSEDLNPTGRACKPAMVDPSLGATISESSEAMEAGMKKVDEVVTYLQGALTGREREIEYLKKLLLESASKFGRLQEAVAAMRRERHKLANDSMRATGFEAALKKMTAERDRAVAERDGVLQALADENASKLRHRFDPRDVQIAELTVKLVMVQRELEKAKRAPKPIDITRSLKTAAADGVEFAA